MSRIAVLLALALLVDGSVAAEAQIAPETSGKPAAHEPSHRKLFGSGRHHHRYSRRRAY